MTYWPSPSYFGAHTSPPLGAAMLPAGALIVIIPGAGQIFQLKITARRHRRLDTAPGIRQPILALPGHPKTARAAECFRRGTTPAPP